MNEFRFSAIVKEKPELLKSENGLVYSNVILDVPKNFQTNSDKEEYDSHKVVCFKGTAEDANSKLTKGMKIIVKGHINANNYEKENGEINFRNELVCDKIEYI